MSPIPTIKTVRETATAPPFYFEDLRVYIVPRKGNIPGVTQSKLLPQESYLPSDRMFYSYIQRVHSRPNLVASLFAAAYRASLRVSRYLEFRLSQAERISRTLDRRFRNILFAAFRWSFRVGLTEATPDTHESRDVIGQTSAVKPAAIAEVTRNEP